LRPVDVVGILLSQDLSRRTYPVTGWLEPEVMQALRFHTVELR
jgi:hypothetical protein